MLVAVGLGEVEGGKGGVGVSALEVHVTAEGVDVGVDAAVSGNGGLDLHLEGLALGIEDPDVLDLKLGIVDLALGNLGHANEDAETGN